MDSPFVLHFHSHTFIWLNVVIFSAHAKMELDGIPFAHVARLINLHTRAWLYVASQLASQTTIQPN